MLDNNNKLLRKIEENTRNGNNTNGSVDLSSIEERLTNLENRTDNDTIYDDSSILARLTQLEQNTSGGATGGSKDWRIIQITNSNDDVLSFNEEMTQLTERIAYYEYGADNLTQLFIIPSNLSKVYNGGDGSVLELIDGKDVYDASDFVGGG